MRILLPSIVDPATHRGGAGTVTRALITLLAEPPLAAHVEVLPVLPPRWLAGRQIASLLRASVSSLPSKALFTYSQRFLRTVERRLQRSDVDLVVLNGSDLLWLLPHLPPAVPRLVIVHNVEYELFRSQLAARRSPLLNALLTSDLQKLETFEIAALRACGHAIFLSRDDAAYATRACPDLRTLTIPPLFDYPPPAPPARLRTVPGLDVGMLGNFAWWPNREGLRWFLAEVFPNVGDDVRLHLFGAGSEDAAPPHLRIIPHGFVPRREDIWPQCDLMLCPSSVGAGVSVKFAEAIYNGMPVLAHPFAARGLELPNDPRFTILEHAAEWVQFLVAPTARELRDRPPSTALARTFAIETHRDAVHAFVRTLSVVNPR